MAQWARLTGRGSLFLAWALVACVFVACVRKDPPPAAPAAPLPADPEVVLDSMQVECDAMVGALAVFQACPNLEDEDRDDLDGWIERANRDLGASRKASPEPNAQKAIAAACRKATDSIKAATERCQAGPRPKLD